MKNVFDQQDITRVWMARANGDIRVVEKALNLAIIGARVKSQSLPTSDDVLSKIDSLMSAAPMSEQSNRALTNA